MKFKKNLKWKKSNRKSSLVVQNAKWLLETQTKIILATVAAALTHKLIQKAPHKYPRLKFFKQGTQGEVSWQRVQIVMTGLLEV